jgi:hypothetical protein
MLQQWPPRPTLSCLMRIQSEDTCKAKMYEYVLYICYYIYSTYCIWIPHRNLLMNGRSVYKAESINLWLRRNKSKSSTDGKQRSRSCRCSLTADEVPKLSVDWPCQYNHFTNLRNFLEFQVNLYNFMLSTPCIFLLLIHQQLNTTQFVTSIDLLCVSAPECHA